MPLSTHIDFEHLLYTLAKIREINGYGDIISRSIGRVFLPRLTSAFLVPEAFKEVQWLNVLYPDELLWFDSTSDEDKDIENIGNGYKYGTFSSVFQAIRSLNAMLRPEQRLGYYTQIDLSPLINELCMQIELF